MLVVQISNIVELFNCGVRKRGNKFAQSALKQSNCIIGFITQNVLFYIQLKPFNKLSFGEYSNMYIILIFLDTFKPFKLCQLAQFMTRKSSRVLKYYNIYPRNIFVQSVLIFRANKLELAPFLELNCTVEIKISI
ncbi:hypothetical protein GO684_01380 [Wolbachia endosymbiont of Litomosoides brasiliensis]|nr:hypothetical protein [Wolbachia endosymbiont of Litomosoides brasiliensis]